MMHITSFLWGAGTGKTHLSTALEVAAIHNNKQVRFFNAVDLAYLLEHEKQHDKIGVLARRLTQVDAVILDKSYSAKKFEKLFVIATLSFLGTLRQQFSDKISQRICFELDKNITMHSAEDIRKHLPEHFPSL